MDPLANQDFFREKRYSQAGSANWFAVCIYAFFAVSCASTSFSYPDAHVIPEDFIGISPDRTGLAQPYLEKLDEFGAVWIRDSFRWSSIEKEEEIWDFSHWDEYVDKAAAAGKKLIVILCFDNPRLYDDRKEHRDLTEREIPYFLKYVEQVVNRYKGRVGAFEIWNEPNGWFWKGSNEHFYALSAAAAKKVKELDPDTPVLAGSLFRATPGFIRGMFKAGAFDNVDGISLHPYSSDALHTVKQVDKLRKIMAEFNCTKPLWITEVGYATRGIYFSSVNLQTYPEYIIKTLSGLAVRGTRNAVWYELLDKRNPGDEEDLWWPGHFFGLMYPDGTLKNGAEAFKLWSRRIPGAEYRPELPLRNNVPASVTSLYFRKGNEHSLLLWHNTVNAASPPRKLFLRVPGVLSLKKHNIVNGGQEDLNPETALAVGREPVFLSWTTEEGFNGEGPVLSDKAPGR